MWKEMKMKRNLKVIIFSLIVAMGLIYIILNVRRSSPEKTPAQPPLLPRAPARVYGTIEPEGGEVFVTAPKTRQIIEIHVSEGDSVKVGQILCTLENSVEKAELSADLAQVELARKALAISQDEFTRDKGLYENNSMSEYEYTHSRLKVEFDSLSLVKALRDKELAQARLEQLDLKSTIDGLIYKFDVRLGESLPEGDNSFIIVGKPGLWVRLYVEAFWMDRVDLGDIYQIRDSETNEAIGKGTVISKTPYLAGKVFRTNDPYERFDIKYQEVILKLQPQRTNIPLGLTVLAEIAAEDTR
jgi:multidrug efflux pump subunit AcrA (membrane-fusion protein)